MKEIKFEMPPWSMDMNGAHDILTMKRGQQRRMSLPLIVIETLRATSGKPTRDQLQKFSRIRRKRFIPILKHLLETDSVVRTGSGTKFDPFRYALGEKELRR